jgi:hypothetical protein
VPLGGGPRGSDFGFLTEESVSPRRTLCPPFHFFLFATSLPSIQIWKYFVLRFDHINVCDVLDDGEFRVVTFSVQILWVLASDQDKYLKCLSNDTKVTLV